MRYDGGLTRAATSSSIVDERRVGRKVVKVKGKVKVKVLNPGERKRIRAFLRLRPPI
jgi:hypothetical protein